LIRLRPARPEDSEALWSMLEPVIRAGETYALPRDLSRDKALHFWLGPGHEVFVAFDPETPASLLGTYFLRANQQGGGSHVANCGYITARQAEGQGVARAMLAHSLEYAKTRGFLAMQFNFVVASNERAVRLWQSAGFETAGRLPGAFRHPLLGMTDALVMFRAL